MTSNHCPCRWEMYLKQKCVWPDVWAIRISLLQLDVTATKVTCGSEIPFLRMAALIHCLFPLPPQTCWTLQVCPGRLTVREPLTAITVKLHHEAGFTVSASLCGHQPAVEGHGFFFVTSRQPSELVPFPICTEMVPVLSQGICETHNRTFPFTRELSDDVTGLNWL